MVVPCPPGPKLKPVYRLVKALCICYPVQCAGTDFNICHIQPCQHSSREAAAPVQLQ